MGKNIGKRISAGDLPVFIERYGQSKETIFVTGAELKKRFGKRFDDLPPAAMGFYTHMQRLAQGLRQIMAGARKFSLAHITRDDIAALTKEAAEISGISYVTDADREEVERILA